MTTNNNLAYAIIDKMPVKQIDSNHGLVYSFYAIPNKLRKDFPASIAKNAYVIVVEYCYELDSYDFYTLTLREYMTALHWVKCVELQTRQYTSKNAIIKR